MYLKRPTVGLVFCFFYLASYFTNKYVLSVLKFTYPTLFQGWQTLVGGFLLHVSWKLGWVEISSNSRSEVLSWLPASVLYVGIIYAGSRALSRLPIPVFFTLHNAAEVLSCGIQRCTQKEKISPAKIWSALFLLIAAGCLPLHDAQQHYFKRTLSSQSLSVKVKTQYNLIVCFVSLSGAREKKWKPLTFTVNEHKFLLCNLLCKAICRSWFFTPCLYIVCVILKKVCLKDVMVLSTAERPLKISSYGKL
ncbi:UDP-N-acetylglucosamine transporter TMEM241 isoform X4 [Ambystoma mexicanum]|uniref:UDP-N-acetylglucosamine transporter TMEM241 isoform X4 n=1 Tax=Ambystoma mexicanum TaxID=8296 RepID=UPI0037E8DEA3